LRLLSQTKKLIFPSGTGHRRIDPRVSWETASLAPASVSAFAGGSRHGDGHGSRRRGLASDSDSGATSASSGGSSVSGSSPTWLCATVNQYFLPISLAATFEPGFNLNFSTCHKLGKY